MPLNANISNRGNKCTKVCVKCGLAQPKKQYSKAKSRTDGLRGECKSCFKMYYAKYKEENSYILKEKIKAKHRLRRYGIGNTEYGELLNRQKGHCVFCSKTSDGLKSLAVDHCHVTGNVRGLLCSSCNRLLGQLERNKYFADTFQYYIRLGSRINRATGEYGVRLDCSEHGESEF